MRCPVCSVDDDKVVDSRPAPDASAIRRRRECLACGHRFTTFERIEEAALVVVKRDGSRVSFDRSKIVQGVRVAAAGAVEAERIEELAASVEDDVRLAGPEVTTERIGIEVLDRLRRLDVVAAVRFASVYKGFDDLADFEREITELAKRT